MQPGHPDGALPDDVSQIPKYTKGMKADREAISTPKPAEGRGEMYAGPIPDKPHFGPPAGHPQVIIMQQPPIKETGGVSVGPFSFKGEGSWILGTFMILLLSVSVRVRLPCFLSGFK